MSLKYEPASEHVANAVRRGVAAHEFDDNKDFY